MYGRDFFHKARTLVRRSLSSSHASSDVRWRCHIATAVAPRMVAYMVALWLLGTPEVPITCPVRCNSLGAMAFARSMEVYMVFEGMADRVRCLG